MARLRQTHEGGDSGVLSNGCGLQAGESSSGFQSSPGCLTSEQRKVRTLALQCYSDPQISILGKQFCATQAYEGSRTDELSVPLGARVQVLETSDRGWWLCRYSVYAWVCVCMCGGAVAGPAWQKGNIAFGKCVTKPCFSCRYNGRVGLFPAVLLQPEGLGSLLGRPGLLDNGGESRGAKDRTVPPVVPTRPCRSAIQSRCCSITRRALSQDQGTQVPT